MTVQLAAEQIESLPIPSYQKMQVLEIVRGIKPEKELVIKEVPVYEYVTPHFTHKDINLKDVAEKVFQDTGITLAQMRSKDRNAEIVQARSYFVRLVLYADLLYNRVEIGKFLKKDHSSTYWYAISKCKCLLPPVPISKMKKYKKIKSPVIS